MGNLIRDNKNILNFLVKKAYPYEDEMYVEIYYHYFIDNNIATYREAIRLYFKTRDTFTWVVKRDNLLYCIDLNKLIRYSNLSRISIVGNDGVYSDISFSGKLLEYIIGWIYKSLNPDTLPYINRMLKYYGITNTEYSALIDFSSDTNVYSAFKAKLREEVMDKSDECLHDVFDDIKFPAMINGMLVQGSLLPLLRYNVKTQNVYIPMRGNIAIVNLMSNAMSGKEERYVYTLDEIMKGNIALRCGKTTLYIRSNNHYDIPLGGAFD